MGRTLPLLLALTLLLAGVALAPVLGDPGGRLLGSATDTLHHAWGLWWFAHGGAEGEPTWLVSFPTGERGALLSPLVALAALPWERLGGPALAWNLACGCELLGAAAGVGLLAATLGRDVRAGALAALAMLVGRPLVLQLGLGVLEGVSVGLAAASSAALIHWVRAGSQTGKPYSLGVGALAALAVVENPYALVLLLPACGIGACILLARERRAALTVVAAAALGGLLIIGLRLGLAGGELGGNRLTAINFTWAGRPWQALEGEGGLSAAQLLSPLPLADLGSAASAIRERGGGVYLGWSVLLLAGLGAVLAGGAGRAAVGLAGLATLLAAGSLPEGQGGAPGPFFFLNLLISRFLPPLTQPVRFLSFASAALAVGAGLGVAALSRRRPEGWGGWRLAAGLLAVEGLLLGGPALSIPTTDLRQQACFADLGATDPGAVHLIAPRGWSREQANTAAVTLQLVHGLPGTHRGIGGWTQEPRDRGFDGLIAGLERDLSRASPSPVVRDTLSRLRARGLSWLVMASAEAPAWAGPPARSCGGWSAWRTG